MNSSTTRLSRARQLHEQGDLDAARHACVETLRHDGDNFEALHLLGLVELQSDQPGRAVVQLERAVELDDARTDVWNHLAVAYSKLQRREEAVGAFERAAALDAQSPRVHFNLAMAYTPLERTEEAITSLRRAIHLQPEFAEAHFKLGRLLQRRGDLEGAVQSLRTATALKPNHEPARKALAHCLEQLNGRRQRRVTSRFGNELIRLAASTTATPADEPLFFVFGVPKSGTTWVQMLLNAHPQVSCRPEDQFAVLFDGASQLVGGYNNALAEVDRRTAEQGADSLDEVDAAFVCAALIRRVLGKRLAEPGVLRSGAKDNGIVGVFEGFAQEFSTARFLFVVRDPRDVTVSSWFHNVRVEQNFEARVGSLEKWARQTAIGWNRETKEVLETAGRLGDRFQAVRYEDLHAENEATLERLFAWLDVDAETDVVRRCMEACSFDNLAGGRQQGTEDRGSFFRRGVCGDWRSHLKGQIVSEFLALAGEAMSRFDYR